MFKQRNLTKRITLAAALVAAMLVQMTPLNAFAQVSKSTKSPLTLAPGRGPLAQVRSANKISRDLTDLADRETRRGRGDQSRRGIIRYNDTATVKTAAGRDRVRSRLAGMRGRMNGSLGQFGVVNADLPLSRRQRQHCLRRPATSIRCPGKAS